ncbi:MAG: hypothetical protein ORN49_09525 [Rhodobacteraceae bacterium]|nr:hypothetical protein [Paracoccaceae bacterium]
MFGGLCCLPGGNMLCGLHRAGAVYRVGKPNDEAALALPGVGPMGFCRPAEGGDGGCGE